jgi:hypothetical protein
MKTGARARRQQAYGTRRLIAAALAFAASAAAAQDSPLSDIDYRVGEGLRIPALGLTLGGYATGTYERREGARSRAALDNASLSVWWEGAGRWKVFGELDYENPLSSRSAVANDEERYLALERFYVDCAVSELATIRAGKFLTPIGRWNQLHATPLVWTTSRPLVTIEPFPTNLTGLMLSGTVLAGGHALDYSIYGARGGELRPSPRVDTFREALGTHVSTAWSPGGRIGFSYVSFEQSSTHGDRNELVGIDLLWSHAGFELSAEALDRIAHRAGGRKDRGGFVQVVAPIGARLHAVARYERYRHDRGDPSTTLQVAGLHYRVTPAVVLKAEWVHGTIGDADADAPVQRGFLSSISLLF